jgi:hypothetical protein
VSRPFRAIDDLSPQRMENALTLWAFLREAFAAQAAQDVDFPSWFFVPRGDEQHVALEDLAAAELVTLFTDAGGQSFAAPAEHRPRFLTMRGFREL